MIRVPRWLQTQLVSKDQGDVRKFPTELLPTNLQDWLAIVPQGITERRRSACVVGERSVSVTIGGL